MMPMFNQSSRTSVLLSLGGTGFNQGSGAFVYNESPYVHALNRTLQLEQAALAIYAAKQRSSRSEVNILCQERAGCHHHALRQLVRIIFAQKAIPDSDPASFTAVTSTFAAKAARWMPSQVKAPVLDISAHRIEGALCRRYEQLLTMAPPADIDTLKNLLEQARDFSDESL